MSQQQQLPFWGSSIHHDGSERYLTFLDESTVTLRIRTDINAPVQHIYLRTNPDGEQQMTALQPSKRDAICQWWEITLTLTMPRTNYRFLLVTEQGNWWLNASGISQATPTDSHDFKLLLHYDGPEWLQDTVFYQIFPDRFADGDPSNNVKDGAYLYGGKPVRARHWGELPERANGPREFFGGDLQGIIQRLDYLEDLGVTALYLNPIFTAPSNHKYDVADYEQVDPHFGGNEALIELSQALHARGMHLMLDVVPNHCGDTHRWFREAQADSLAPSAEFFTFRHHPDDYEKWLGIASLPKLNYRSELLRQTMYAGEHAIMRRWLRPPYQIDAWRIDVANMLARQGDSQLGHKIGRGVRRAVKGENPEVYVLGENFYDGTPHLQGEELDGTMNYRGFSYPLLYWLAGKEPAALWGEPWADHTPLSTNALAIQWQQFLAAIPWQVARQEYNLLDSHDTPRALWMLGGDTELFKLAAALLFTYPGVPAVYYGDEVGLDGAGDPDNRRCMPWDPKQWNHDIRTHYQQLIQLRRTAPALLRGGFQLLHAAGETLAFLRESSEQRMIVVAQRSDEALDSLPVRAGGIADGTRFSELFSGTEATVSQGQLPLPGLHSKLAQIWIAE